jgi:hypothetical protein
VRSGAHRHQLELLLAATLLFARVAQHIGSQVRKIYDFTRKDRNAQNDARAGRLAEDELCAARLAND